MELSADLLKRFVQVTNDKEPKKKETTVYGTVVKNGESTYVKFDGSSNTLTPAFLGVCADNNDRVIVNIKNHSATITNNLTSPPKTGIYSEILNENFNIITGRIASIEMITSKAITTDTLSAALIDAGYISAEEIHSEYIRADELVSKIATIDSLTANDAFIKNIQTVVIDADYIKSAVANVGYLTADSAVITSLQTDKLNTSELNAKVADLGYLTADSAVITSLQTDKLNTSELNAKVADLGYLTADSATITGKLNTSELNAKVAELGYLTANNAVITGKLDTNQLSAEVAKLGYLDAKMANIDFANLNKANIGQLFANVGLISSATITDGHVTGYLDSVEVNANKITAGTLAVDRLLIKDSSGNYKMATYDSSGNLVTTTVNGSVITNRTITADHLVAGTITANEINMTNLVGNSAFINAINTNSIVVSASNNASSALSTANTANSNASNALNTANSANTTANSASSTANSALSTANTANSNASSAISTANSASSKAQGIIDNIYTPNTTTINGGKITTGSITANEINMSSLVGNSAFINAISTNSVVVGAAGKDVTIDLSDSAYNQNLYYPVVFSIPGGGFHEFSCNVCLNSGTKPSWSTHPNGFTVNVTAVYKASGWGTTDGMQYITESFASFTYGYKNPVFPCQQCGWGSFAIFMVRGGGRYYFHTPASSDLIGIYRERTKIYDYAEGWWVNPVADPELDMSGNTSGLLKTFRSSWVNNWTTPGTTTIDGGSITTNSIKAAQIDVNDLFAQNITASGTITGATLKGSYVECNSFYAHHGDISTKNYISININDYETWNDTNYNAFKIDQYLNDGKNLKNFRIDHNTISMASMIYNNDTKAYYGKSSVICSDAGEVQLNGEDNINLSSEEIYFNGKSFFNGDVALYGSLYESGTALSNKYAPISHTHDYLPLSGGTVTGATQFNNYLKLNAWSGYGTGTANFWYDANNKFVGIENATGLKLAGTKVSKEGHTHNYAGSSSAGGSANSLAGFTNTTTTATSVDNATQNGHVYVRDTSGIMSHGDGACYVQAYSTSWVHQIYGDYQTGQIAVRGKNNGTWQAWRKILDSSNYTSYCTPSNIGAAAASHTHSSVSDIVSGSNTTFAYSKEGLDYSNYTWLAGWNGYELRAVNKNQFAPSTHTHTKSQITDFPTSLPASDVYSWAKQSTKPSYALNEITGSSDIFKVVTYSYNSVSVASGSSKTVTPSRTNIPSGYTAVAVYTVNSGGGRIYPRAHSADGTIVLVNESSAATVTPIMKVLCVKSTCVG